MTARDISLSLRHMLDHAEEAVSLVQDRKRPDLEADRQYFCRIFNLSRFAL